MQLDVDNVPAHLPTEEDVQFYEQHGYYVTPVIIPDIVLDRAERGMERFYAGDRDWTFPPIKYVYDDYSAELWQRAHGWHPNGDLGLRKNDYSSLQVAELAQLTHFPVIAQVAARLSRSPQIRLWHDQIILKPPETTRIRARVGWHTDRQYWLTCSSKRMLTAWVPFHDVTLAMGPIAFIDRSHLISEELISDDRLDFFNGDLSTQESWLAERGIPFEPVAVPVSRGQVTFHHCLTIHGSGPNNSVSSRRSMSIHMQPGDNTYVDYSHNGVHENDLDMMCRHRGGIADYTDENMFPLLWRDPVCTAVSS
ncbi:MAG: phytanoyl-CoA dioxygenase family protein [Acidimicrobiales bacterium]